MKVAKRYYIVIILLFSITYCPFSKPHSGGGPGEDCEGFILIALYRIPGESTANYESRRNLTFMQYYNCMTEGVE